MLHKEISYKEFYTHGFMTRDKSFNHFRHSQDLFHQYVDMAAKMEYERPFFIRNNKKQLQSENYIHLRDAVNNGVASGNLAQLCILPSSFTGKSRYIHERTQDAMTDVRNHSRPDLFETFTCNLKWKEIEDELFLYQKAKDRFDILARVFRRKSEKLMNLIWVCKMWHVHK